MVFIEYRKFRKQFLLVPGIANLYTVPVLQSACSQLVVEVQSRLCRAARIQTVGPYSGCYSTLEMQFVGHP